jgi:hypothetical protein
MTAVYLIWGRGLMPQLYRGAPYGRTVQALILTTKMASADVARAFALAGLSNCVQRYFVSVYVANTLRKFQKELKV